MMSRLVALSLLVLCAALVRPWPAAGQNNFEIQVYGSDTVAPGTTMVELHSNVAAEGSRRTLDHVLRTQGARDHPGHHLVVRDRLLPLHQHPARHDVGVGRQSHPAA